MPEIRALDIYRTQPKRVMSSLSSGAYIDPIDEGDGVECPEDGQQSTVDPTHESLFVRWTVVQRSLHLDYAVLG